jgi:hypothetical protein
MNELHILVLTFKSMVYDRIWVVPMGEISQSGIYSSADVLAADWEILLMFEIE